MQIQTEEQGKITIVKFGGEIDLYNAPEVKETIQKLVNAHRFHILFDLGEVTYVDSSGIGAMISSLTNVKRHRGSLKLCNLTGPVKKVFELTKLNSFFEIYSDSAEAIEKF